MTLCLSVSNTGRVCSVPAQPPPQASRSQSSLSVRSLASVPPFTTEQPAVQLLRLHKTNTGMGLSIVAAKVRPAERTTAVATGRHVVEC